jgi:hypothetical protein
MPLMYALHTYSATTCSSMACSASKCMAPAISAPMLMDVLHMCVLCVIITLIITITGPMDMTRGALTHTSEAYPGAYLADRGVRYVTVAGTALEGMCHRMLSVCHELVELAVVL